MEQQLCTDLQKVKCTSEVCVCALLNFTSNKSNYCTIFVWHAGEQVIQRRRYAQLPSIVHTKTTKTRTRRLVKVAVAVVYVANLVSVIAVYPLLMSMLSVSYWNATQNAFCYDVSLRSAPEYYVTKLWCEDLWGIRSFQAPILYIQFPHSYVHK